jgi:hypothetical protein
MNRGRPTRLKREKEKARIERRQEKEARREAKKHQPPRQRLDGLDPDIADITPGPQPSPWEEDDLT